MPEDKKTDTPELSEEGFKGIINLVKTAETIAESTGMKVSVIVEIMMKSVMMMQELNKTGGLDLNKLVSKGTH